ncbi:HPr family phosphocarrier protein [Alkalibacillus haloalkaliphilus]|uniref:HPr-like protein Crh n=1 Tax=Alkalibacillus haloalkaliphilus TaxID=94136 RepID=A0A511WBW8_9BACI|nr:HPr family phosphocarrier protein [Alkalibacillus haloalkaliphilus]MDV2582022.1 HPr family phosphocarrier protein [Alkalibacillus haloalkaliphilus]GEN46762.1 HPr-like protein Crh [Alkalibacillus haloalkaliphilus]
MVEKKVTVNLETGLQARPAAKFVQEANRFSSEVFLEKGSKRVNAKSIMGVMSLAIGTNEEVTLQAEGADQDQAITTLASLMESEE